jgi:hypothetical protein
MTISAIAWVLALSASAAAAPPKAEKVTGALPAGVKASGALDAAWSFTDKSGIDYVLFSSKHESGDPARARDPEQSAYLFVDVWVLAPGAKAKLVRTVRDKVEGCDHEPEALFHDAAFGVTDLDGDGVDEVTFAYETGCRSDVSPNTYKLLLLRGADKYILRGTTFTRAADGGSGVDGGQYTPDPDAKRWPKGLLDHAKDVWKRTAADSAAPPASGTMDGDGGGPARHGPYDPPDPCGG